MATSIAALPRARIRRRPASTSAAFVAGHSLGEYSALCAAGALRLADTARLLRLRGEAMQAAVPVGQGAMAALLGLDLDAAAAVAARGRRPGAASARPPTTTTPRRWSSPAPARPCERAVDIAKARGAKRALLLPVSAPFHCVAHAARRRRHGRGARRRRDPRAPPCRSSPTSPPRPVSDPEEIRDLLVRAGHGLRPLARERRLDGRAGVTETWEIGAGKALSGMIRRTAPASRPAASAPPRRPAPPPPRSPPEGDRPCST